VTATASRVTPRFNGLARRTVYGVVLAIIVFGSIVNLWTFTAVVLAITLGSLYELAGLTARKGQPLVLPVALLAVASYILLTARGMQQQYETVILAGTLIASLAVALFGARQGYFARSAYTVFGALYIGWLGSYFVVLRTLPTPWGATDTAACILIVALTDIFAMLIGTAIGRTPLSSISPKKTWEGAIGGLVVATLAGAGLVLIPQANISWWDGALIGAFTSIAAQAGDLVESALKRDAHVKDAGTFLGNHGGILDRFDSYIFGGIAFYAALHLTGHIPPH
jgi:phosphatidate cytidylyltransferase